MSSVSKNSAADLAAAVDNHVADTTAEAVKSPKSQRSVTADVTGPGKPEYDAAATAASFAAELAEGLGPETQNESIVEGVNEGALNDVIERFGRNDVSSDKPVKMSVSSRGETGIFPGLNKGKTVPKSSGALGSEGLYSKVPRSAFTQRRGKVALDADTGLFPFNYVAGRGSEFTFTVSRDDRMAPTEARARLAGIFSMYGIENEPHDYLYSFTHAMLVAHALNGASVVGPGRAAFMVGRDPYSYGDIVKSLGQDMRRFFRAYADETAKALALVLQAYDPCDAASVTICGQVRMIAVAKRLIQFPYLIHDSADACVRINVTEAAAVLNSKTYVLDKKPNAIEALGKPAD